MLHPFWSKAILTVETKFLRMLLRVPSETGAGWISSWRCFFMDIHLILTEELISARERKIIFTEIIGYSSCSCASTALILFLSRCSVVITVLALLSALYQRDTPASECSIIQQYHHAQRSRVHSSWWSQLSYTDAVYQWHLGRLKSLIKSFLLNKKKPIWLLPFGLTQLTSTTQGMDEPSKPGLFTIKFWLLLGLSVPSTICSIFIFVYFCQKRKKLSAHLRFTFLLVLISFLQITTDLPFVMIYYYQGEVAFSSDSFCLWWNWWDYSTSSLLIFAMAWGCIERYFLVFYNALLSNRRKRFIFHAVPLIVVCAYPLLFYLFVIIFNSCENTWQFDMVSDVDSLAKASRWCLLSFCAFNPAIWLISRPWPPLTSSATLSSRSWSSSSWTSASSVESFATDTRINHRGVENAN